LAQISAAIPAVVHPASISIVFCAPVPIAVPSAPDIAEPEQPHPAPVLWSLKAETKPEPSDILR
jgi:hypothetical protein